MTCNFKSKLYSQQSTINNQQSTNGHYLNIYSKGGFYTKKPNTHQNPNILRMFEEQLPQGHTNLIDETSHLAIRRLR